jgi:hypothetical protein
VNRHIPIRSRRPSNKTALDKERHATELTLHDLSASKCFAHSFGVERPSFAFPAAFEVREAAHRRNVRLALIRALRGRLRRAEGDEDSREQDDS